MRISSQLVDAQIEQVATLPVAGKLFQIVALTTNETLYYWDGSDWMPLITEADAGAFLPILVDNTDSPLTLDAGDKGKTYVCDTSSAVITINLPAPTLGMIFGFKDQTGSFATNAVSLVPTVGVEIEGLAATYLLQADFGSWTLASDGVGWFFL